MVLVAVEDIGDMTGELPLLEPAPVTLQVALDVRQARPQGGVLQRGQHPPYQALAVQRIALGLQPQRPACLFPQPGRRQSRVEQAGDAVTQAETLLQPAGQRRALADHHLLGQRRQRALAQVVDQRVGQVFQAVAGVQVQHGQVGSSAGGRRPAMGRF